MSMTHKGIPWVRDITTAEFRAEVIDRSHAVPVLVDFWAPWCAPCRALGPILERLAAEYAGGFEVAKVDTEKEPQLASEFQVRSIPMVTLFKDGKAVGQFLGALPEGQIREFLRKHAIEAGGATAVEWASDPTERVAQIRAAVKESPERDVLKLELALALLQTGELDEAAQLLEALPALLYGEARAEQARAQVVLERRARDEQDTTPHATAVRTLLAGNVSDGMAQLIDMLREEKGDEQSPARATLVQALQFIADEAVVREWRQKMARVLF